MLATTIFLALTILAAVIPFTTAISANELDVQVYRGDGAVGIIVSQGSEYGFDVVLDSNSSVIVTGNGVGGGGGGNGSGVSTEVVGNETTIVEEEIVSGNETGPITQIEIPHINNITTDGDDISVNYTGPYENITSSTDVVEIITGVNYTDTNEEVVGGEVDNETSTAVEEGIGCLSESDLNRLLGLFGYQDYPFSK
jgi:hypothetical protein